LESRIRALIAEFPCADRHFWGILAHSLCASSIRNLAKTVLILDEPHALTLQSLTDFPNQAGQQRIAGLSIPDFGQAAVNFR
jgi:hypothetical protein